MRYQILGVLFVCVLMFGTFGVPKAQATDVSSALSRMDAIIKEIQLLRAEFANLASAVPTAPTPSVLGATSKTFFTQSLEVGETNSDIEKIQELLATDPDIYPYGVTSGFFGPKTEEGIKNFQARFGLKQVGVVGPATKALLELFITTYPDGKYPADVLKKKPQVLGASTSTPTPTKPVTTPVTTGKSISSISAEFDKSDDSKVKVKYTDGTSVTLYIAGDTKLEVVDALASEISSTRAVILDKIEFTTAGGSSNDDEDEFNVEVEIDDDETTVTFEFDGDDYEVTVDGTDEDDVLDEVADELNEDVEDLDNDLVDAIEEALDEALDDEDANGDEDEIESITASIADGEAEIEVEYGNGDDENFTVEEDLESEIIEEVADELNMDESDVEDIIEFEYEDVDSIAVDIENGKALAIVTFEDGTTKRIRIDSDDEGDIIEAIAEELDEDEDDVEDWTEFDYLD